MGARRQGWFCGYKSYASHGAYAKKDTPIILCTAVTIMEFLAILFSNLSFVGDV